MSGGAAKPRWGIIVAVDTGPGMNLTIYLLLALVAGATWGTSLCYLLKASKTQASELKQWLSLAASMLVVVSCAVVMKNAGEVGELSFTLKASAAAVFLASLGAAFLRSKLKP